jgi:hypothetical protein
MTCTECGSRESAVGSRGRITERWQPLRSESYSYSALRYSYSLRLVLESDRVEQVPSRSCDHEWDYEFPSPAKRGEGVGVIWHGHE